MTPTRIGLTAVLPSRPFPFFEAPFLDFAKLFRRAKRCEDPIDSEEFIDLEEAF